MACDALHAEDRVAVLVAGRDAVLVHALAPIGDGQALSAALAGIEPSLSADLSAGLARALTEARRARERRWSTARHGVQRPDGTLPPAAARACAALGTHDPDAPPHPDRLAEARGLGPQEPAARGLLDAAAPVELVVVADGEVGRGLDDRRMLAAMAARGRAHGVRSTVVATGFVDADAAEPLAAVAEAGDGAFCVGDDPAELAGDLAEVVGAAAEPGAARAVSVVLRPAACVAGIATSGHRARAAGEDGHVVDLGDLREGETRRLAVRLALRGRRRPRGVRGGPREARPHRATPAPDGDPAAEDGGAAAAGDPQDLGTLEVEWLVGADGRSERVRFPLHRGGPTDGTWTPPPARAWSEPLPSRDRPAHAGAQPASSA